MTDRVSAMMWRIPTAPVAAKAGGADDEAQEEIGVERDEVVRDDTPEPDR